MLVVTVTNRIEAVADVDCIVVEEAVSAAGKPIEKTTSYYAQDKQANVWYFGDDV